MNSNDLERRFTDVADALNEVDSASMGLTTIARGITELVSELQANPDIVDPDELEILLEVFETFVVVSTQKKMPARDSLRDLFEMEARKRMAGLSISMMGIFHDEPGSIELTTGHLHAIKGSASMLGLSLIADLTGIMEQVVFELSRRETADRKPAIKPLLRSFAILESLIEAPDEGSSAVTQIRKEFEEFLGLEDPPTLQIDVDLMNEFLSEHQTDVQVKGLEKRILIVDDEETIAASVAFVLADLDVPVDIAQDGAAALDRLNTRPYSLVISDIGMPNIDGFALLEIMRSDHQFADIPVVLLTARDNEGFRKRGEELGCEDYIIKGSIGGGALRSRVAQLLSIAPSVPRSTASDASDGAILVFEQSETVGTSIAFTFSDSSFDLTLVTQEGDVWSRVASGSYDLLIVDGSGADFVHSYAESGHDVRCLYLGALEGELPEHVSSVPDDISDDALLTIASDLIKGDA